MKITVVLGAFFPVPPILGGAVEKVWFALAQEFVRQGHEVVQISRSHPQLPAQETRAGVQHLRVSGFAQPRSSLWLKFLDLIYSLRVRAVLPEAQILVTNTFWLPMLVRGRRQGLVYVHVQRGPKGQMRFYGHVARLLAVSRAIADAIVAEAPRLRDKVRVIANPVPQPSSGSDEAPRRRTLLFVGRVHPEKGLELLVRAFVKLPGDLLETWRLEIVGPAETRLGGGGEEFGARLREIGLQSAATIEWAGPIFDEEALAARYRSTPFFVYPSIAEAGEALPVAPLEAMTNGCAPIVSDLACFRDYIEDGVTGFIFSLRGADPVDALRDTLSRVLRLSPDELETVRRAAQEKSAEFDLERIARQYLGDFERLLTASCTSKDHPPNG